MTTHNELKKGAKVLLTGGRTGTIMDNRRGIRRMVKIDEKNGFYGDCGDVYVDEIIGVLPPDQDLRRTGPISAKQLAEPIELVTGHEQQMKRIRKVARSWDYAQACMDEWNRSCEPRRRK